jgi:hypothetical protein
MNPTARTVLRWTPRVLALAYLAFLGLFALDVFSEASGFWQTIGAFLAHLIPHAVVLLTLLIAWRWSRIGGAMFIALGAAYIVWAWGIFPWSVYAVIAGPPAVIGVLFILSARWQVQHRPIPAG